MHDALGQYLCPEKHARRALEYRRIAATMYDFSKRGRPLTIHEAIRHAHGSAKIAGFVAPWVRSKSPDICEQVREFVDAELGAHLASTLRAGNYPSEFCLTLRGWELERIGCHPHHQLERYELLDRAAEYHEHEARKDPTLTEGHFWCGGTG